MLEKVYKTYFAILDKEAQTEDIDTFKNGMEFKDFYDINILGSFSMKGTTKDERFGNPTPRIAECTSGMINSVGLQNPGVDFVVEKQFPMMKNYFKKPIVANISGFSIDEYVYCAEKNR